MSASPCIRHPDAPAAFECDGCRELLCVDCVEEGKFLTLCCLCGERTFPLGEDPLAAAALAVEDAPPPELPSDPSQPDDAGMASAEAGTMYGGPSRYESRDEPPKGRASALLPLVHHVVVPAATVAMVAAFLFYLVDLRSVFLPYGSALKWLGFWFTTATVLIARYSKMTGDREGQGCYTVALAAATLLVVLVSPWERGGAHPGGRLASFAIILVAWRYASHLAASLSPEASVRRRLPGERRQPKLFGVERLRFEAFQKKRGERQAAPPPRRSDAHGNPSAAVARLVVPALAVFALGEPVLLAGPPEVGLSALASVVIFLLATGVVLAAGSSLGTLRHARAAGGRVSEALLLGRIGFAGLAMTALLAVSIGMPGLRWEGSGEIGRGDGDGVGQEGPLSARDAGQDGQEVGAADGARQERVEGTEGEADDDSSDGGQEHRDRQQGETDRQSADHREGGENDSGDADPASQSASESASTGPALAILQTFAALGKWLRIPFILAVALIFFYVVIKMGPQLGMAPKTFLKRLAALWRRVLAWLSFQRPKRSVRDGTRLDPWTNLGELERLAPREAVQATYVRFLVALESLGHARGEQATPYEILHGLPARLRGLRPAAAELTELYVRAAYGTAEIGEEERRGALGLLDALRREHERLAAPRAA